MSNGLDSERRGGGQYLVATLDCAGNRRGLHADNLGWLLKGFGLRTLFPSFRSMRLDLCNPHPSLLDRVSCRSMIEFGIEGSWS